MMPPDDAASAPRRALAFFGIGTVLAWVLFHGAPLAAVSLLPYAELLPTGRYAVVATAALVALVTGLALAAWSTAAAVEPGSEHPFVRILPAVILYLKVTVAPLVAITGYYAVRSAGSGYATVDPIPSSVNIFMYVGLTLMPIVLWNRPRLDTAEYWGLLGCVILPRLVVSLFGPRFYVLQAAIPVALWELMHAKALRPGRLLLGVAAAYAFLFHVVPWARNDPESGFAHLLAGSPLGLLPELEHLGLLDEPRPRLVMCEIAANVSTVDVCGLRQAFGVPTDVPVRIDQVATYFVREATGLDAIGTGGNPIVEAFPGLSTDWNVLWFLAIGALTAVVLRRSTTAPLCAFLFPHVTSKALFLWRGTISEFFDRLPLLCAVYVLVLLAASRVETVACES